MTVPVCHGYSAATVTGSLRCGQVLWGVYLAWLEELTSARVSSGAPADARLSKRCSRRSWRGACPLRELDAAGRRSTTRPLGQPQGVGVQAGWPGLPALARAQEPSVARLAWTSPRTAPTAGIAAMRVGRGSRVPVGCASAIVQQGFYGAVTAASTSLPTRTTAALVASAVDRGKRA
jgi:hypothetical protein